jgi:hypothetical protein
VSFMRIQLRLFRLWLCDFVTSDSVRLPIVELGQFRLPVTSHQAVLQQYC